ncbi:hypothetical protein OG501_22215 [Streptomyces niveus]|uniref:hypothetical protein n=1 Tax=Streptomyces niveus TaxID=193462 RepID=UPI003867B10B
MNTPPRQPLKSLPAATNHPPAAELRSVPAAVGVPMGVAEGVPPLLFSLTSSRVTGGTPRGG